MKDLSESVRVWLGITSGRRKPKDVHNLALLRRPDEAPVAVWELDDTESTRTAELTNEVVAAATLNADGATCRYFLQWRNANGLALVATTFIVGDSVGDIDGSPESRARSAELHTEAVVKLLGTQTQQVFAMALDINRALMADNAKLRDALELAGAEVKVAESAMHEAKAATPATSLTETVLLKLIENKGIDVDGLVKHFLLPSTAGTAAAPQPQGSPAPSTESEAAKGGV